MGVRNGRIFHPGVYLGVRKWRILCVISANFPPGVGGRFFARGVRFFELPGTRKGGLLGWRAAAGRRRRAEQQFEWQEAARARGLAWDERGTDSSDFDEPQGAHRHH